MEFEELKVEVPVGEDIEDDDLPDLPEKKYENKAGSFVTGFDVNSKEAKDRRNRRANRFGIEHEEKEEETQDITEPILTSLPDNLPKITKGELRNDALLVYGVNDMSTRDVFGYFKDYGPGSIEWIDDASCNVVWDDDYSAGRALVALSRASGETDDTDKQGDGSPKVSWRAGLPCDTSKERLFMRFATKKDKKLPGAAKRSMYYLVHGYPGQEKAKKGVISASRKRKIAQESERTRHKYSGEPDVVIVEEKEMEEAEKMEVDDDEPAIKVVVKNDRTTEPSAKKPPVEVPARLRMRMYADDLRVDAEEDEDEYDSDNRDSRNKNRTGRSAKERMEMEERDMEEREKQTKEKEDARAAQAPRQTVDLRSKLKSRRRHGFDFMNRPSLSIEIREEQP